MIKNLFFMLSIVTFVFLSSYAGAVPAGKTVTFDGKGAGTVIFAGKAHADKGFRCSDCHQTHLFKMKRGADPITMKDMEAGKYCGACHNGNQAFSVTSAAECGKCHAGAALATGQIASSPEPVKPPTPLPDGKEEFEQAKAANTLDAYRAFLDAFPSSPNRRPALQAMAGLIGNQNGSYEEYRTFVAAYKDGLEFVPEKHRLALIGPEGMRVHDIIGFRKRGIEDNVIAAKIRMGKGEYKDFSFDEIDQLKKMGLPGVLIEAMLDATVRAKREEEELQKKKDMEDLLAEIQRMQKKLAELKTAQASGAAAPVTTGQGQGPSVNEAVKNCTAQVAALEACKRLPNLAAMVCKATAKSQFPCE